MTLAQAQHAPPGNAARRLSWTGALVGLLAAGCSTQPMLDHQYVYFPRPWEARDWRALSALPLEEVWLTASDGVRLFGWYVEAPQSTAVLLWTHGNAGNVIDRLDHLVELHHRGLSVFIFDYRGYGRSDGRPSEEGLYRDGLAAYAYLVQQRGVAPQRVVLFGQSLGAAVAGELALQRPAAGLILETPFTSILELGKILYPYLPVGQLIRARFDLAGRVRQVRMPVLVLHGDRDTIVPLRLGQAVFEAANEPKRFHLIPGADHNDTYLAGGEAYFDAITGFVEHVVQPGPRAAR